MEFQEIIYENSSIRLMINFTGTSGNLALAKDIKLQFFAFDKKTYREIFNETLDISDIRILCNHLNSVSILKDSSLNKSGKFIELSNSELIKFFSRVPILDKSIVSVVLGKISTEDILKSLSILDLDNLSASHKQQKYKLELHKLKLILNLEDNGTLIKVIGKMPFISEYLAKQPEKILQNWLEKNLWVFGVEYEKMEGFRKISLSSEGDLIMKSIDGYLDLIELKKSKYDLLRYDSSHKCYHSSSHLSKVLGQSMHYIKELQDLSETFSEEGYVKVIRPRVKVVAGRSNKFDKQQFDTLRMINSHLVDISVVTYDEILKYGNKIISHYESK